MVATPRMRKAAEKHSKNIERRGQVVSKKEETTKSPLSPTLFGFLVFVVVGSSIATTFQFMWQTN